MVIVDLRDRVSRVWGQQTGSVINDRLAITDEFSYVSKVAGCEKMQDVRSSLCSSPDTMPHF